MIWLVLFGLCDSDSEGGNGSETNIKINIPMGHVAKKAVSVNFDGSHNVVTSIWSVECSILSSM